MLYVDLFESEAIEKFAYDLGTRRLVIFFKSGGVYEYEDVPRTVFDGFRAAQSKGEFFQSAIRIQFASRRLSPSEVEGIERSPGRGADRWCRQRHPGGHRHARTVREGAGVLLRLIGRPVTGRDAPPGDVVPLRTRSNEWKGSQSA